MKEPLYERANKISSARLASTDRQTAELNI